MKREIKFRGIISNSSEWVHGFYVILKDKPHIFNQNYAFKSVSVIKEVIPKTIGQYTGLKDKNGAEIYEGDILRVLHTDWPSKPDSDKRTLDQYLQDIAIVGSVYFTNYEGWCIENENYFTDLAVGVHGYTKVIGNIHENPELLES